MQKQTTLQCAFVAFVDRGRGEGGRAGTRGRREGHSSGFLTTAAQTSPSPLRLGCASTSRPQHSSALLQHSQQVDMLRVRPSVRGFQMHLRGPTKGARFEWGCIDEGSSLPDITGVSSSACTALITIAAAFTIIATALASPSQQRWCRQPHRASALPTLASLSALPAAS